MLRLKRLSAWDSEITDLTGLEHATFLIDLGLCGNQIHDLRPLAGLIRLEGISLCGNQIADISPLANLTNLKGMDLSGNQNIVDITPLANLTQLDFINLSGNSIEDITILTNLTQLVELHLDANKIRDISPLANLVRLENLRLERNQVSDLSPLANHPNLEELYIRDNLVNDFTPLQGLNLIVFEYDEVCDIPPLSPPVRERIENRTFPSIYQAWGDVVGLDHLTWEQRSALHDLSWGPFFWITSNWNTTPMEPNWGIATSLVVENAHEARQRWLTRNPNHVFLADVKLHVHNTLEAFPLDSDFWLRDAQGQIIQNEIGEYLIDFLKPEVQDLLVKRIIAIERCGVYDGVFLDNFFLNSTLFASIHSATEEEIMTATENILRGVRSQTRDDFLIIVNASHSKPTRYTEFINGTWMEITLPMEIVSDNWDDDPLFRLQRLESVLSWVQENLRSPQITCLQGEGIPQEPPDSRTNRRWMRVFTTMSLTHSDGYVLYNTGIGQEHVWYPFWDADLGRPVGPQAQLYQNIDGLFIREFTNGWAVYNRSGKAQKVSLPESVTGVSSGQNGITHILPDLDGEIYLKAPNPADVNGDGRVNILDLVQVANGIGKSAPDPNGDGAVNILDLVLVAQQFSQ